MPGICCDLSLVKCDVIKQSDSEFYYILMKALSKDIIILVLLKTIKYKWNWMLLFVRINIASFRLILLFDFAIHKLGWCYGNDQFAIINS